jgi:hypothetical protein
MAVSSLRILTLNMRQGQPNYSQISIYRYKKGIKWRLLGIPVVENLLFFK